MKKITIKRVVYHDGNGKEIIGGKEYDGKLTNENILGALHEVGYTKWIGSNLWVMKNGIPVYRVTVEPFVQYQKSWYDLVLDAIRRV